MVVTEFGGEPVAVVVLGDAHPPLPLRDGPLLDTEKRSEVFLAKPPGESKGRDQLAALFGRPVERLTFNRVHHEVDSGLFQIICQ